jgi:hypothetical protein
LRVERTSASVHITMMSMWFRRGSGELVPSASSSERIPPRVRSLDLDWRFLLPPPQDGRYHRLLLLGVPAGVAEQVEGLRLAREVALEPSGQKADAVICVSGARLSLQDAAAHLGPQGVLYYEAARGILRPGGVSPAHLLRTLRRLELVSAGLYWVHPAFTGPRTYFPLEVDGALKWYLSNLHSSSARFSAIEWAQRRLLQMNPMLAGRLAPRLALVAVAGTSQDVRPLPFASADLPPPLHQPGLRPLLLIHGTELSRAVMLPFSSKSTEPLAVFKIRRGPVEEGDSSHEPEVLEEVRASLDASMRSTMPKPLGAICSHGLVASIESFLPGEWLHARLARRRLHLGEAIDDLRLATAWITQLHSGFPVGSRSWSESDVQTYVDLPIATYDRELGTKAAESELFLGVKRLARDLLGTPLPIVWQHGDFSNLNTLRSGHRLHVVDWERAAPGIPLDDLLHFARLWLYLVRRATRDESFVRFRDLFLRRGQREAAVDAARAAISEYMGTVGVDRRFLPLLLTVGCVRRASDRLAAQVILSRQGVDPRDGNRYVTYVDLLSNNREALFNLGRTPGTQPVWHD